RGASEWHAVVPWQDRQRSALAAGRVRAHPLGPHAEGYLAGAGRRDGGGRPRARPDAAMRSLSSTGVGNGASLRAPAASHNGIGWLAAVGVACLLAGCDRALSTVDPAGPQAERIDRLTWLF